MRADHRSVAAPGKPDSEPLRFRYLLVLSVSYALPPFSGGTHNITERDGNPEIIAIIFYSFYRVFDSQR